MGRVCEWDVLVNGFEPGFLRSRFRHGRQRRIRSGRCDFERSVKRWRANRQTRREPRQPAGASVERRRMARRESSTGSGSRWLPSVQRSARPQAHDSSEESRSSGNRAPSRASPQRMRERKNRALPRRTAARRSKAELRERSSPGLQRIGSDASSLFPSPDLDPCLRTCFGSLGFRSLSSIFVFDDRGG
jgi:hypothetical protein